MSSPVFKDVITLNNPHGLHLRVASELVKLCKNYQATVELVGPDGASANCASPLSLLMLAATQGTKLQVLAEGADALEAGKAVVAYFSK